MFEKISSCSWVLNLLRSSEGELIMSGGTPTAGGGLVRLRFNQVYNSSGEDIEDDACSRTPMAAAEVALPAVRRARTWPELAENLVWVLSAVFIVYFGDWEVNMISLLWADARIRRTALHLGLASAILNVGVVLYTTYFISSCPPKSYEKSEVLSSAALLLIVLGFISFCLLSYALWPIWNVLTIPLLFTLFMASIVVSPYLLIGPLRPQSVVVRAD